MRLGGQEALLDELDRRADHVTDSENGPEYSCVWRTEASPLQLYALARQGRGGQRPRDSHGGQQPSKELWARGSMGA